MKIIFPLLFLIFLAGGVWAEGIKTEHHEAIRDLSIRAGLGEAKALYDLARLHDTGYDTIPRDTLRSTALYLESAKKGYAPAMNFIGFRYYNGEGMEKNIDSALYWIGQAATAGDITAAANLGYLLTESPDIPHDEETAVKWLTIASENGVRDAQLHLLKIMNDKWQQLPPDSALKTGTRYYEGAAPIIGVRLIEIAATSGNPKALALLGDAYSKGRGVAYDHSKSIEYFFEAANAGNPSAQFILGELLDIFPDALDFLIVEPTRAIYSAQYWYQQAAEGGVSDSESAYTLLYSPD